MAHPGGRPTKYREEYCQMLIEHMAEGYSFESFAAKCDCHWDSLYEWAKLYPEFSEARKTGQAKSIEVWERIGLNGATGAIEKFNAASWIFNMKNRFRWTDRFEVKEEDAQFDERKRIAAMSTKDLLALVRKEIMDKEVHDEEAVLQIDGEVVKKKS